MAVLLTHLNLITHILVGFLVNLILQNKGHTEITRIFQEILSLPMTLTGMSIKGGRKALGGHGSEVDLEDPILQVNLGILSLLFLSHVTLSFHMARMPQLSRPNSSR